MEDLVHQEGILKKIKLHAAESGIEEYRFKIPKIIHIDYDDTKKQDIPALIKENGLAYPLILKPDAACGAKSSHFLALVFSDKGLAEVQEHPNFK